MIPIDIPSLRKLLSDATPGPWRLEEHGAVVSVDRRQVAMATSDAPIHDARDAPAIRDGNAALIVASVNALGPLLDRIEAQQAFIRDALTCVAARGDACFAAHHCTVTRHEGSHQGLITPAEGPRSSDHEESKQSKEKK